MDKKSIFGKEAYDNNVAAERQLNDLLPQMDEAEECGVDCQGYRAIAQGLVSQLRAIREKFMNKPTIGG